MLLKIHVPLLLSALYELRYQEGNAAKDELLACWSACDKNLSSLKSMKILRAVGLVLLIIGLQLLMSEVFAGFEQTLLKFFQFTQSALDAAQTAITIGRF